MFESSWASTYDPDSTLQLFFNYKWHPVTISRGKYFYEIPFPDDITFNHITKNYISWMVTLYIIQYYGNLLMIPLPRSFTVLILLSTSTMCSCDSEMLTYTFSNFSVTFSSYIPIIITHIMKPPLPYNPICIWINLCSLYTITYGCCVNKTFYVWLSSLHMALSLTYQLCTSSYLCSSHDTVHCFYVLLLFSFVPQYWTKYDF